MNAQCLPCDLLRYPEMSVGGRERERRGAGGGGGKTSTNGRGKGQGGRKKLSPDLPHAVTYQFSKDRHLLNRWPSALMGSTDHKVEFF